MKPHLLAFATTGVLALLLSSCTADDATELAALQEQVEELEREIATQASTTTTEALINTPESSTTTTSAPPSTTTSSTLLIQLLDERRQTAIQQKEQQETQFFAELGIDPEAIPFQERNTLEAAGYMLVSRNMTEAGRNALLDGIAHGGGSLFATRIAVASVQLDPTLADGFAEICLEDPVAGHDSLPFTFPMWSINPDYPSSHDEAVDVCVVRLTDVNTTDVFRLLEGDA
jgi:hypothetical protein